MTVYALMPVHNRREMTQRALECVRAQVVDEPLKIVVIDDGSVDGSYEHLRAQSDVTTLCGDGSLWWSGAIELGLRHVLDHARADDWVLLVNNDTEFAGEFVQTLIDSARRYAPAVVGSVVRDIAPSHRLLSIGARVDSWWLRVQDLADYASHAHDGIAGPKRVGRIHEVDAVSGRGALYPVSAFMQAGTMRPRWLPHYLADYELSIRVGRVGFRLLVDERAVVHSHDDYGTRHLGRSLWARFLSVASPSYVPAVASFWWEASTWWQRMSLPLRMVLFHMFPSLRRRRCEARDS